MRPVEVRGQEARREKGRVGGHRGRWLKREERTWNLNRGLHAENHATSRGLIFFSFLFASESALNEGSSSISKCNLRRL